MTPRTRALLCPTPARGGNARLGVRSVYQEATIDSVYEDALAAIADGPAKMAGIALGKQAAVAILA